MYKKPRYILTSDDCLIGDVLMHTPAIRQLRKSFPAQQIIYKTPHNSTVRTILKGNPNVDSIEDIDFEEQENDLRFKFTCTSAFAISTQIGRSMPEAYQAQLGIPIKEVKYDYYIDQAETARAKREIQDIEKVVFCASHSKSCTSNTTPERTPNKCFSQKIWCEVASKLKECGYNPVAIGGLDEEQQLSKEWVWGRLYGLPIRVIAAALPLAKGVISIDCGIRHLAAATGANLYTISCAIPLTIIHAEPTKENQRVLEENIPIYAVTAGRVFEKAMETFKL